MNGIEIKKTVKLNLSADDWGLYDMPGRNAVARAINKNVAHALNYSDGEMWLPLCTAALLNYAEYGAADSDGYRELEFIIRKFKGE